MEPIFASHHFLRRGEVYRKHLNLSQHLSSVSGETPPFSPCKTDDQHCEAASQCRQHWVKKANGCSYVTGNTNVIPTVHALFPGATNTPHLLNSQNCMHRIPFVCAVSNLAVSNLAVNIHEKPASMQFLIQYYMCA